MTAIASVPVPVSTGHYFIPLVQLVPTAGMREIVQKQPTQTAMVATDDTAHIVPVDRTCRAKTGNRLALQQPIIVLDRLPTFYNQRSLLFQEELSYISR